MQWYYVEDGNSVGPVEEGELNALAAAGKLNNDSLVWHEGMPEWVPLSTLQGGGADTPVEAEPVAKSKLSIKHDEPATDIAQPQGPQACCECGKELPVDSMIQYEGVYVCGECKPAFFQRVKEGVDGAVSGGVGATHNRDLMEYARGQLAGSWGLAIGITVVFQLVNFGISISSGFVPIVGSLVPMLIAGPLSVGLCLCFMTFARGGRPTFSMIFEGFKSFTTGLCTYLLMSLYVGLWMMLLIVPGIIAAFAYSMAFYIAADHPDIRARDALKLSKEMMKGMKWKYFCLSCRFIGWSFVGMLTLGIGFLWIIPYMYVSMAAFYDDVKGRASLA